MKNKSVLLLVFVALSACHQNAQKKNIDEKKSLELKKDSSETQLKKQQHLLVLINTLPFL